MIIVARAADGFVVAADSRTCSGNLPYTIETNEAVKIRVHTFGSDGYVTASSGRARINGQPIANVEKRFVDEHGGAACLPSPTEFAEYLLRRSNGSISLNGVVATAIWVNASTRGYASSACTRMSPRPTAPHVPHLDVPAVSTTKNTNAPALPEQESRPIHIRDTIPGAAARQTEKAPWNGCACPSDPTEAVPRSPSLSAPFTGTASNAPRSLDFHW